MVNLPPAPERRWIQAVNQVNSFASNLKSVWMGLEPRRRAVLVISLMTAIIFLGLMIRVVATPTLSLLYSGLDSSSASGVIEALDRQGVQYEVRGDAIYVPSNQRDRVRISLAGEGLPMAGSAGYELLDGLSGFGTTAEMFDAAYWRAKEGELARTLLAFDSVVRARVHIANTSRRPFSRDADPTASVTVSTSSGALSREQAEAIRYLVASAVGGLQLSNVAVIDQEHGVVLKSGEAEAKATAGDDATLKAAEIRRNVIRLLEARVGPGAAVVEVSVETSRDSETVRERSVDPSTRVIIHKDTEESTDAAEGESSGVTVASNLAEGDVEGGDQTSRQASRTRERLNYEVSEVLRESVRPPGQLRRISVAVMIDGLRTLDENGQSTWTPRPPEELQALQALVESAVGFDAERGDIVNIQSLELSAQIEAGSVAENGFVRILAVNAMSIAQVAVLGVVAIMLGLFVIRPIMKTAGEPPILPGAPQLGGGVAAPVETGEGASLQMLNAEAPAGGLIEAAALGALDRKGQLEAAVTKHKDRAVRVISGWLDGPDTERAN